MSLAVKFSVNFGRTVFSKQFFVVGTDIVHKTKTPLLSVKNLTSSSSARMFKKALVVIAGGSEEIEAVTPIDVLRRAGVDVTVAGLHNADPQQCSRNVCIVVEKSLQEAKALCPFDAILLPGGAKGAEAFVASEELGEMLREQDKSGRIVASICAGPTALKKHGIGIGKSVTSYPSFKDKVTGGDTNYNYKEDRVVIDGNIITSRGPGTALEWSLAVAKELVGKETADQVAAAMLLKDVVQFLQ